MILSYDLLALAAAACWGVGSLISVGPSRHMGAFAYTRWRMLLVSAMLWSGAWLLSDSLLVSHQQFWLMALSGLVGIFIGDTAYFASMNRLGPRRTGVLFTTNAIFSVVLGFLLFGERMGLQTLLGGILTVSGVMIAIAFGQRRDENHHWEVDRGSVRAGIAFGLLSAFCQAAGSLIAKPVMADQADPIVASAIRSSVACAAHLLLLWSGFNAAKALNPPDARSLMAAASSSLIGMALGMTLFLLALRNGDVGLVSVLSSVTPILLLPMLWLWLRRAPAPGAWFGATLTVLGTALILTRGSF